MGDPLRSANAEMGTIVHAAGHLFVMSPDPVKAAVLFIVAYVFFWVGRETAESIPYSGFHNFFAATIVFSFAGLLALLPGKLEIFVWPALGIVVAIVVWFGVLTPHEKQSLENMAEKLRDMSRRARGHLTSSPHD